MAINVLLVDDSTVMRKVIEKTLISADVSTNEIYHACNGKEALDILKEKWIDLVLADINMPVMNGLEMIDKMSEISLLETIPVVIVSTEGSSKRMEHLKSKGVRARVRKPFTPEVLRAVIEDALGIGCGEKSNTGFGREAIVVVQENVKKILEEMVFLFPEEASAKDLGYPNEKCVRGKLAFGGDREGELSFALTNDLCKEVTANILGLSDDSITPEIMQDGLAELLSIFCGNIFTSLVGVEAVIDLRAARVSGIVQDAWDQMAAQEECLGFEIDGSPVLVTFTLGQGTK